MNKVALFAIIGTAMFLLSAGSAFAATPSTATVHIQPDPTLNANVTWSTYNSTWAELEYFNGTAYQNLTAQPSVVYSNPITVNPADILSIGNLQNNKIAGSTWWNNATPAGGITGAGSITTFANSTIGTIHVPEITANTTGEAAVSGDITSLPAISTSQLPSNNPAYDYITVAMQLSGKALTGVSANVHLFNGTSTITTGTIFPGESLWLTMSLAEVNQLNGGKGYNTSGNGALTEIQIIPYLLLPQSTLDYTYSLTVTAFTMTEYPIYLGQNSTGQEPTQITGNAHLSVFHPTVPMNVIDNGYTVAVSQPLENLTTQQNAISSGNYIEQVEYQGQFDLPTAPDLSYGPANLTEAFNISTSQTQVIDINGVSYLSTISGKNGTISLLSSVNPNEPTQFLQIVDYTESQWTSISSPPGIFSLAGIEYYWEELIIAILAVVGIGGGAAAKHASNLRKVK